MSTIDGGNSTVVDYIVPDAERLAIAVTAGMAAVLNTLNGAGTGGDIQTLVAIGSVSCARSSLKQALEDAQWCLTPLSFGPEEASGLYGTFGLAGCMIFLHFLVFCYAASNTEVPLTDEERQKEAQKRANRQQQRRRAAGRGSSDDDDDLDSDDDLELRKYRERRKWQLAGAKVLYPSFTYLIVLFFFQGLSLRAFEMFTKNEETFGKGLAMSFVATVFALFMIIALIVFATKYNKARYIPYKGIFQCYNRFSARYLFPGGFWAPREYVKRLGFIFWCFRGGRAGCTVMVWIRMVAISIVASLESIHGNTCSAQFAVFGVICFGYSILVLILRPLRSVFANVVSALSNFLVSLVAFSGFMDWEAMPKALLFITAISLCSGVINSVFFYKEVTDWWAAEEKYRTEKGETDHTVPALSEKDSHQLQNKNGSASGGGSSSSNDDDDTAQQQQQRRAKANNHRENENMSRPLLDFEFS